MMHLSTSLGARSIRLVASLTVWFLAVSLLFSRQVTAYNTTGEFNTTLTVWNPSSNSYTSTSLNVNLGVTLSSSDNSSEWQDQKTGYVVKEEIWVDNTQSMVFHFDYVSFSLPSFAQWEVCLRGNHRSYWEWALLRRFVILISHVLERQQTLYSPLHTLCTRFHWGNRKHCHSESNRRWPWRLLDLILIHLCVRSQSRSWYSNIKWRR